MCKMNLLCPAGNWRHLCNEERFSWREENKYNGWKQVTSEGCFFWFAFWKKEIPWQIPPCLSNLNSTLFLCGTGKWNWQMQSETDQSSKNININCSTKQIGAGPGKRSISATSFSRGTTFKRGEGDLNGVIPDFSWCDRKIIIFFFGGGGGGYLVWILFINTKGFVSWMRNLTKKSIP